MRVGLVSPYDLDRPGGVQAQVLGLAHELGRRGHVVSVLGPGAVPGPGVVSAGRSTPVRGNGSVARLALGPLVPVRVARWIDELEPDVVHVHEPAVPGLGPAAVRRVRALGLPVVGTFHASRPVGRAARAGGPVVRRVLGPLPVTTAVSEEAREVARLQYGLDPEVVPNALDVAGLAPAGERGSAEEGHGLCRGRPERPTVLFLGRRDEPRKGLDVLARALPVLRALVPTVQVVLAGPGRRTVPDALDLGEVGEDAKATLLHEVDVLVAPHTGRESFGIVLAEAMAAGTPVVASDLPAFRAVVGDAGLLVPVGDHHALARALAAVLLDPGLGAGLRLRGRERVGRWDWSVVGDRWETVYDRACRAPRRAS